MHKFSQLVAARAYTKSNQFGRILGKVASKNQLAQMSFSSLQQDMEKFDFSEKLNVEEL